MHDLKTRYIKYLEKKCWNNQTNMVDIEQFAEKLILECASLVDDDIFYDAGNVIRENFGIEEEDN